MVGQPHYASASLYVGDLAADVNETALYEVFSAVGPVASIRVCRETGTRRSLGYAYINYHSIGDGAGNIYVKNLDKVIDNKALHDTFSLFGNILSCKVATDEYGKSKGYGFVHYESEESAKSAIEKVNGMQIGSKTVYVGPFKKQDERPSNRETCFTNLYVKQFPEEWTEETLRSVFSPYGTITSMVVSRDPKGRRFALVNFETTTAAQEAVRELHGRQTTPEGLKPAGATVNGAESKDNTGGRHDSHEKDKRAEEERAEGQTKDAEHRSCGDGVSSETTTGGAADQQAMTAVERLNGKTSENEKNGAVTQDAHTSDSREQQNNASSAPCTATNQGVVEANASDAVATSLPNAEGGDVKTTKTPATTSEPDISQSLSRSDSDALSGVKPTTPWTPSNGVPEGCLYVQRAMTKAERVALLREEFNSTKMAKSKSLGVNLYVKNLDSQVTDDLLREAFSQFGTVTSAKVMRDDARVSKGFGFVCFAFPEEATKAVTAMHLRIFHGKPLYVGLAEKRDHRTARLQQRYRPVSRGPALHGVMGAGVYPTPSAAPGGGMPSAPMMLVGQHHSNPTEAAATLAPQVLPYAGASPAGTTAASMYYAAQRPAVTAVPGPTTGAPYGGVESWRQQRGGALQAQAPSYPYAFPGAAVPPVAASASGAVLPDEFSAALRPPASRAGFGAPPLGGPAAAAVAPAQSFKFTSQARNRQEYDAMPPFQHAMPQSRPISAVVLPEGHHAPLSAQTLAAAHPQMQKQMLGERLFPLVHKLQPELAGKITGMMLEMDNAELLSLLESETLLCAKVDEALGVLHRHQATAVAPPQH